jgi:putative monooxygenase
VTASGARKVSAEQVAANRKRGGDLRALLTSKTVGATSGFMGVATLAPDEYVSEHYHPYSEEFLYVVSGRLRMVVDGTPIPLAPGEALYVPKFARHRLENGPDGPAVLVYHLSPLAPRPDLGHVDTEELPADVAPAASGEGR